MKVKVQTLAKKAAGDIELNDAVFGLEVRKDVLHRAVNWQLAKRQAGTHKTKQRSEITATTAKPFRQKGTGRARQGSVKVPQMRGGGVAFGPQVRSHATKLPKKFRQLALKTALSAKQKEGKLTVVDALEMKDAKTKAASKSLNDLGLNTALFIDGDDINMNFALALRNLHGYDVLPQQGANVYDILSHEHLVLSKAAVAKLEERLA